jgi:hypothetical protein
MLWSELLEALEATVLVLGADFEVGSIAAADLLSDILATEKEEFVILTGQTTLPAIRTALAVGALGVVVVRGKSVPEETVTIAASLGIPLAVTDAKMFEACVTAGAHMWNSPSSKS